MFVSQAIPSSIVCNACRKATQSALTASPSRLRRVVPSSVLVKTLRFGFTTSATRREGKDHDPPRSAEPDILSDSIEHTASTIIPPTLTPQVKVESESTTSQRQSSSQPASIPWYLQHQASIPPHAQQPAEIPALPPNPPPLLASLLEYVSITAGLDDLQLLDLRHLDPPPALGPKLIMILATARSEKHLHVAADRFCRHLRREYGLKANAAGLLGRNELKIKLRRKAKRMRMMANVGGTMPEGNIDDGIRTGWICCTIGKIEAHPMDAHMPGDDVQDFVGFRDIKPGVNVVVQMFTEEKRAEIDLETLWGGVLRTHQRKDKSADEALQELEGDIEELEHDIENDGGHGSSEEAAIEPNNHRAATPAQSHIPPFVFRRPQPSPGDVFPPASSSYPAKQLRRLHTVGLR